MPRIYLASPYGFVASCREFLDDLKARLSQDHHEVLDPWELGVPLFRRFQRRVKKCGEKVRFRERVEFNRRIGDLNRRTIESAEVIVAALDGCDVDSGTASEVGFAFARGKTILGYRNDLRKTGEEGAIVNLQVQYWIEQSGGRIVDSIPDLLTALDSIPPAPSPRVMRLKAHSVSRRSHRTRRGPRRAPPFSERRSR